MSDPGITTAYAELLTIAYGARDALRSRRPELTAIDEADAESFLAGLIEGAMQFVDADPARPAFVPWVTPSRRWMDNGRDSLYWMAPVDGHHRYRLAGRRGEECYLSLTVYAGDPGHPQKVVLNRNHVDLAVAEGGEWSIELEPPADACYVITRQYLTDPLHMVPGRFTIEVIDGPGPDAAASPEDTPLAARWRAAAAFLRAMTVPAPSPSVRPPAYVSTTPNVMGDPSAWRDDEGGGRGTPDQTYALGPYALGPDEALVMDVQFPSCAYASAAVWNRFSQTVDRRFHRSTINHLEAEREPDGTARLVVAHRDPGVANWLDTGGRPRGTVFWRFLLADWPPPPIVCTVVPIGAVAHLPGP